MKKKIIAYQINGQTVGVDLLSWLNTDLKGNEPFRCIPKNEDIPSGYVDISSIENYDKFGLNVSSDHMSIKKGIVEIVQEKKWSGLTNNEKDIVIKYYAYDDEVDPFLYLVYEKGMSFDEARLFLVKSWHTHHGLLIDCYRQRWFDVKYVVGKYLSIADAQDLFKYANLLIYSYTEAGVVGRNYGDNVDGLLDFVESTNGFENNGLRERGYIIFGNNWEIFIQELINVLVFGIYNGNN